MKNKILRLLYQRGDFLSGEEISQELQISRAAVWKHIVKLKEEGQQIEAVTNKGYRLKRPYRGQAYGWELEDRFAGLESGLWKELVFEETLDSSNLEAKRRIQNAAARGEDISGTVVTCEMQTAGRGRRGRRWESPAGSGIWVSLVLKPDIGPDKASMMTLVAGMAVRKALSDLFPLKAGIKWPNDIIVDDRKICGILTEMTVEDMEMTGIVVGIGINVSNEAFPEELRDVATSVNMAAHDKEADRASILMCLLGAMEEYYERFLKTGDLTGLMDEYNEHCINAGRMVHVIGVDTDWTAQAIGIDRNGGLRLIKEDGEETTVSSGEVTIRGVMGYAK